MWQLPHKRILHLSAVFQLISIYLLIMFSFSCSWDGKSNTLKWAGMCLTVNIIIYSILWKYKQWCSVSFHSKWFMLGDFNRFILPSDMRSIKMSQLQLCTYLFHFTLSFGEGEDIGSDALAGYGMSLLLLAHMEDISFIHCLIFSLLRSLDKLLLTQLVLDQALRELTNVI